MPGASGGQGRGQGGRTIHHHSERMGEINRSPARRGEKSMDMKGEHMKRLNEKTGLPFKFGDTREDGFRFDYYKKTKIKKKWILWRIMEK